MATEDFPSRADASPATITQSVAVAFAGFGLLATLSMGWMLARSTAGLPPFPGGGRPAPLSAPGGGGGPAAPGGERPEVRHPGAPPGRPRARSRCSSRTRARSTTT